VAETKSKCDGTTFINFFIMKFLQ